MEEKIPRPEKYTKEEADYGPVSSNPAVHRCGICVYYKSKPENPQPLIQGEGDCKVVHGDVAAMGGCKLFSVDLVEAANDPVNLANHPPKE